MSDIGNQAAWSSVVSGLIYNPETAIAKYWAELKAAGQYVGVPTSDEMPDPDTGGVQMSFSSGVVIAWDSTNGVSLR